MVLLYSTVVAVLISGLSVLTINQRDSSPAAVPVIEKPLAMKSNQPTTAPPTITKEQCAECHDDAVTSFDNTAHARAMHSDALACESCHGNATEHIEAGGGAETMVSLDDLSAKEASEVCLSCHEQTGEQSHMRMSEHTMAGVSCTQCHDPHPDNKEKLQRVSHGTSTMMRMSQTELCMSCHQDVGADFKKPSHHRLQEGVMECSSCHNAHGTMEQKQLLAEGKENCVKCHEDKRGPFAFEHDAGNLDGCTSCHQPHGSSAPHMLKARDERTLCVSCHSREGAAGTPHSRLGLQATGDCTRCHSEIHGSHSDPFLTH